MNVLKFGGTSVGTPRRMKEVVHLINDNTPKIVVLSAVSGTTNTLVEIAQYFKNKKALEGKALINELEEKYLDFLKLLYASESGLEKGKQIVMEKMNLLRSFDKQDFNLADEKQVLAQGELLSTRLFYCYCLEQNIKTVLLPALNFMRIKEGEPDEAIISNLLLKEIEKAGPAMIYITQGYICRNEADEIDNLRRGGSDYSASLIGAALQADEIQIWTDIDGIHNNDPRIVNNTFPIHEISFKEAAELAYFGAKILHPSSVLPAQKANIPVRLLNTLDPAAAGTIIRSNVKPKGGKVRAIAAKDGIIAIKIRSSRMLLAYGFLKRVFEVFEQYKTPIDMITTSEIAVSLTIDDGTHLDEIVADLQQFGYVEVDYAQTIVCIVGKFSKEDAGVAVKVLTCLKKIPVRMISSGGSESNISILIHSDYKTIALQSLNEGLFSKKRKHIVK